MGPVLLDNVMCTGNETRLFDCEIGVMGTTNCPAGDAGVRCSVQCMSISFLAGYN